MRPLKYTLTEIRNGTGFPEGARFILVMDDTEASVDQDWGGPWSPSARRAKLAELGKYVQANLRARESTRSHCGSVECAQLEGFRATIEHHARSLGLLDEAKREGAQP